MTGSGGREGPGECVSSKERPLISLKETHNKIHTNTHECGQDKVLKCGPSEPPVAPTQPPQSTAKPTLFHAIKKTLFQVCRQFICTI